MLLHKFEDFNYCYQYDYFNYSYYNGYFNYASEFSFSEANSVLPLKSVDNDDENLADKRDAGQWLKYEAIRGKRIVH